MKGVFYAGDRVDLEDCAGTFQPDESKCSGCPNRSTCPRSQSRNAAAATAAAAASSGEDVVYDVVIVGAGCIGSAIARELSRYSLRTLLLESADDVSQGATKGNSGIVHARYDNKPGSLHAKYCWPGNQMFPQLGELSRGTAKAYASLACAVCDGEHVSDQLLRYCHANLTLLVPANIILCGLA